MLEPDCVGTIDPHTYFLGIRDLPKANAESIHNKVVDVLDQNCIKMGGLAGSVQRMLLS